MRRDAAVATVATPWGPASELRKRKLHPGSGTPREEVARNQRERIFGAIVAVVSEKGYEASTVADVIAVAGVSRGDFYKHFANKAECLAAAAAALWELALGALEQVRGSGPEAEGQATFEKFISLVATERAAARVCLVEIHAAGEPGEAVARRGTEDLAQLADRLNSELPEGERVDPELMRVLIEGLGKLIQSRLNRDEDGELEDLAPELWRWLRSVKPAPETLAAPRRQRVRTAKFEGYTPAERIVRAVAEVVAEKGYGAMSTDDIAARAAISLSTFYEHFADKRDAVLAALEMGGAQITALAMPAARRAGDWQEGVRALYEAICAYFVAEPAMAELATVGVYGAGASALARRDRVIDSLGAMLAPGFEENPGAPSVSAEACGASVYALMRRTVRRAGPERLAEVVPLATYLTLVPFVGPERACVVANGNGRGR